MSGGLHEEAWGILRDYLEIEKYIGLLISADNVLERMNNIETVLREEANKK